MVELVGWLHYVEVVVCGWSCSVQTIATYNSDPMALLASSSRVRVANTAARTTRARPFVSRRPMSVQAVSGTAQKFHDFEVSQKDHDQPHNMAYPVLQEPHAHRDPSYL